MNTIWRQRSRDERGATLILFAMLLLAMVIMIALVIDLGLLRSDRKSNKSTADRASAAGVRGLEAADGVARSWKGVCTAYNYFKANSTEASQFGSETWADGTGNTQLKDDGNNNIEGSPCETSPVYRQPLAYLQDAKCTPGLKSSWAWFTGVSGDGRITVEIKSGYRLDDAEFNDDPSVDQGSAKQDGCDQLAVIVRETQPRGFSAVIGSSNFNTKIRSVARAIFGEKGDATVALLLLEQTGCPAVNISGGGGDGFIKVDGTGDRPGIIHADSDGTNATDPLNCVSGGVDEFGNPKAPPDVVEGFHKQGRSLLIALPAPDPDDEGNTVYGIISTYAKFLGRLNDADWNQNQAQSDVWMCYENDSVCPESGPPIGRDRITRMPADARYWAPLVDLRTDANTIFTAVDANTLSGYTRYNADLGLPCTVQQSDGPQDVNAKAAALGLPPVTKLYVDCNTLNVKKHAVTIGSSTEEVVFKGDINVDSGAKLDIVNPRRLFVTGSPGTGFQSKGDLRINAKSQNSCAAAQGTFDQNGQPSAERLQNTQMVVRRGPLLAGAQGAMKMCGVFVHLMGGTAAQPGTIPTPLVCDGFTCVGPPPYPVPYDNSMTGTVEVGGGGNAEWTAPNKVQGTPGSSDFESFEDLALWTEASAPSVLQGNGGLNLVGIFFMPNANPVKIGGTPGAAINADAQFFVRRLDHNGNAAFFMKANPADSIPVPFFQDFALVR